MEKKTSKIKLLKAILKHIKLKHYIILILLLSGNTFAWFIFSNQVNTSIDVHVRAWKVVFTDADKPISDYVNINVDELYPGTTFQKVLDAYNESDVNAKITYKILSANILGDIYITKEGRNDNNETVLDTDLTSEELSQKLLNDYPFIISFEVSQESMEKEVGEANFTVNVNWEFESGDDERDTYWGNKAYEYKKTHPTDSCISIAVKIFVTQST